MKFLGLCGSLRARSFSMALLRAAQVLAPPGVELEIFLRHGELPLFNPDDEPRAPEPVRALWQAVTEADAIVIASPEYAHGVTGNLKNSLDWLVGHPPFAYKPVAVLNPAYQSRHADAALREILRTMSADLVEAASLRVPVIGSGAPLASIAADPRFAARLGQALAALAAHVRRPKP